MDLGLPRPRAGLPPGPTALSLINASLASGGRAEGGPRGRSAQAVIAPAPMQLNRQELEIFDRFCTRTVRLLGTTQHKVVYERETKRLAVLVR